MSVLLDTVMAALLHYAFTLHSIGPLPVSPAMSITSQFSATDLNNDDYQFTTYTNGFYPVVMSHILFSLSVLVLHKVSLALPHLRSETAVQHICSCTR